MKYNRVKNFINGNFVSIDSARIITINSPIDGSPLTELPCSMQADLHAAVEAAKKAFLPWSKTPVKERVQVFSGTNFCWKKICLN